MAELEGGEKLKAALADIGRKLKRGGTLKVGFFENARYPDGTSVAMVAAIQEYGAPAASIPPRPFLRPVIKDHEHEWPGVILQQLKAQDGDVIKALSALGEVIVHEIQQSIIDVTAPPLSPITIMLRKMRKDDPDLVVTGATVGEAAARVKAGKSVAGVSTKPLIDTSVMYKAVAYEVEEK